MLNRVEHEKSFITSGPGLLGYPPPAEEPPQNDHGSYEMIFSLVLTWVPTALLCCEIQHTGAH